jgi:hypothetical protein
MPGAGRHSPFTAALVKHLPTPGLQLAAVTQLIRTDVMGATGWRQTPWDHTAGVAQLVLVPAERKP